MFRANHEHRRRWPKVLAILLVVAVLSLIGGVYYVQNWYRQNLRPLSASDETIIITIPAGSALEDIAKGLESKGVIRSAKAFSWYIRSTESRDKLKAGTYRLKPSMSSQEIIDLLIEGRVATDLFTILPGQRLDQIRQAFLDAGFAVADVDNALKPEQYADFPALTDKPRGASLEGYLYPESFQKTADTKASDIIAQSLNEMQKRLTPDIRSGIAKQGLSIHEGVVLASIIEKEVSEIGDRRTVAQVFLRRLKINMPLGADATFFYASAITGQRASPDLDSPYNTRKHQGLPPGPISNVSEASLTAVATPDNTDYLFFVSGDDGKTYFSHTQAEHEALTKAHCKKLCELP